MVVLLCIRSAPCRDAATCKETDPTRLAVRMLTTYLFPVCYQVAHTARINKLYILLSVCDPVFPSGASNFIKFRSGYSCGSLPASSLFFSDFLIVY